jgi:bifunctional non-homologous end joining protein LigD
MTIKTEDFQLCESTTEEEAKMMNDKDFVANIKFDGERIIAVVMDNQSVLVNRRGRICNFNFEEVVEDMNTLPNGIYDGEVISLCDTFNKLQSRAGTKDRTKLIALRKTIPVKYMVFDILNLKTQSLVNLPLRERVIKLNEAFKDFKGISVEKAEYKPINEMLEKAHKEDREGIIVKSWNGTYEGKRSKNWLKCKFWISTTIKVCRYESNPKGITVEDCMGNRCLIAGQQSLEVKQMLDTYNEAEIRIQFLEKTVEGRFRFPSFLELVK